MTEATETTEAAALGALLLEGERLLPYAVRLLTPEAFTPGPRRDVAEALWSMAGDATVRGVIDTITLSARLKTLGAFERIGGMPYLHSLVDACVTPAFGERYLELVAAAYALARCEEEALAVAAEARTAEDPAVVIAAAADRFAALGRGAFGLKAPPTNEEELAAVLGAWKTAHEAPGDDKISGLPTPWWALNRITCGMEPGLIILAGRPSQGKTTAEDNIAVNLAAQGVPVGRVTLDMTRRRLLARAVCRFSGVSLPKLKCGYAGGSQLAMVEAAARDIAKYPMWIEDSLRDVGAICAWARAMHRQHKIRLLTIDYVQLVGASAKGSATWNENQTLTYVSTRLKALALELRIPVLLLSQLSRESDKMERRPRISDLRGSGSLEQDASQVWLCYRDEKAAEAVEDETRTRPIWIDVAKNQDGETARIAFWMLTHYFKLVDTGSTDKRGRRLGDRHDIADAM